MKNIITIMSKEFARFFGDKRMLLMVIVPAVLIYASYSFMGTLMSRAFAPDEDHTTQIYSINTPASVSQIAQTAGLRIQNAGVNDVAVIKDQISNGDADLLMIFPQDFDAQVEAYSTRTGPAPNVEIYFISTEPNSSEAYYIMTSMLDAYKASLVSLFDINRGIESPDLATSEDFGAMIISMMMPMLLMIFLFAGCQGLALESITGEKERGTLATLLVSPLKRRELAIGKILSLAVLSFLSGSVTAVATMLALPNMMGGGAEIDVAIYSVTDYLLLAFIILSVLLLMVAMISIISAYCKTVKEAGQATMPLMIVVMLTGISGMFGAGAPTEIVYYLIPLYGSVQGMSGIFGMHYSIVNVLVACLSTLVYAGIGGFVLTKMFNSEKIMFSK